MKPPIRRVTRFVSATALGAALILAACDSGEPWKDPGPRDRFDAFLMHYFRGESREAYEYVLPLDRAAIEAPLKSASLPQGERPEPHEMLVVADVENVYDITRMELESPLDSAPAEGEAVKLILHLQDGTKSEATMVWNESNWYVDLPLDAPESEE